MRTKLLYLLSVVLIGAISGNNPVEQDACYVCHSEIDEDMGFPVLTHINEDIHIQNGLGCADCHGGNPDAFDDGDAAMWDDPTFIGIIDKKEQPKVCGSCHSDPRFMRNFSAEVRTDQVDQYWASQHGTLLKSGDNKVAVCTSCHGVHGIRPVDHPLSKVYPTNVPNTCGTCHSDTEYMRGYNIPTNQVEKYNTSVHGITLLEMQDLYSPACNDCHGNHGAIPPNVAHISDICGSCHVNNKNLFQESFHRDIFLDNGINECEACHGNHAVMQPNYDMLYWGSNSICMTCHDVDDDYAKDLSMAFFNTIDSLNTGLQNAELLVSTAEQKGMEISDLFIHLEEANKILIQTKTSIHGFDIDEVNSIAEKGFESINEAKLGANEALDEFDYRRNGLFIFSIILTLTIIMLYFKLKQLQKNSKKQGIKL